MQLFQMVVDSVVAMDQIILLLLLAVQAVELVVATDTLQLALQELLDKEITAEMEQVDQHIAEGVVVVQVL